MAKRLHSVAILFSTNQYNNSCKQFAQYKLWIKQYGIIKSNYARLKFTHYKNPLILLQKCTSTNATCWVLSLLRLTTLAILFNQNLLFQAILQVNRSVRIRVVIIRMFISVKTVKSTSKPIKGTLSFSWCQQ